MTERLKEQLSAFLDGELPEAETTLLLKRLERDDDLKGTLSRYSLIGAVLRTDGDVPAARYVAARVSAAIAREPALSGADAASARSRWVRPAAGVALAASVAVATLLLMPVWSGGGSPAATVASTPGALAAQPESVQVAAVVPVVEQAGEEPAPSYTTPPVPARAEPAGVLSSAQLASFLVAHSEYTSPLARRSVVTTTVSGEPAAAAPRDAAEDAVR